MAKLATKDLETAQENDAVLQDLYILANLGIAGAHKNKIHSELIGKVERLSHLPEPYSIHIPLKEPHNACKQGLLLAHKVFSRIYYHKDTWNKSICLGPATLKKFWYAVRGHPTMDSHPIKSQSGYDSYTTCNSWGWRSHRWHWEGFGQNPNPLVMVQPSWKRPHW